MDFRVILFKNTFWLGLAEVISRGLKFLLLIYAARILGVDDYGVFSFALAFASILVIFSDFGLTTITTRDLARNFSDDPMRAIEKEKEFSSVFSLKMVLTLATYLLIFLTSFLITESSEIHRIIFILGVFVLLNSLSDIFFAFFRARQKMEYEALAKIFQAIIVTGLGFWALFKFPTAQNLAWVYSIASAIAVLAILIFFNLKILKVNFFIDTFNWRRLLQISWPLGLVAVFTVIYNSIDSVMLGYWGMIKEVGWYNAAYRVILIISLPTMLISSSFFPALSSAYSQSREFLRQVWRHYLSVTLLVATPIVVLSIWLAPQIVSLLYGSEFEPTVLAFRILAAGTWFMIIAKTFMDLLIVCDQQKKIFWVALIGAVVNIILNFLLIPVYRIYGAAIATFVTLVFMSLVYLLLLYKNYVKS